MSYDPDDRAQPIGKLFTRQLSQRDLSLAIPVNFVEHAGISLTAACFATNRYVEDAAQRCFSNLLTIGFHRYEVDLYWDVSRQLWSLCPVQMGEDDEPPEGPSLTSSATGIVPTTGQETDLSMIAMSSQMDAVPTERDFEGMRRRQATATNSQLDGVNLPQASSRSSAVDPNETPTTTSRPSSSTSLSGPSSESSGPSSGGYQQLGPYRCSESVNLDWLSRILWSYLDTTETNLNATLRYMILNLHAAAPASDPEAEAAAPASDELPNSDDALSSLLASNLSSFLYTPANLRDQRANINSSWYDIPQGMAPNSDYYQIRRDSTQSMTFTLDGWPSESYVEMEEGKRLFVGFGSIDAQMEEYDLSRDSDVIFPRGYLQDTRQIAVDGTGRVISGCFDTPSDPSISASNNNSWAFVTNPDLTGSETLLAPSNLTRCGISPILNVTVQNTTADENFIPYQNYLQSTVWSWAPDYPQLNNNTSLSISDNGNNDNNAEREDASSQSRCAVLNATSGFWQNVPCDSTHYSACLREGSIYDWSITSDDADYTKAGLTCPDGTEFDVPRTGLQNTYLLNTWRADLANPATDSDAANDNLLYLNLNNIDSELCWVVGQNSTCPYVSRRTDDRQVIVPIVAAVLVFALGVLTVFVKCAANRQMNKRRKRRRRGDDGWDYEGVPS